MSKSIYTLTDEHRAQLKPWSDKWIKVGSSTGPYSNVERETARVSMRDLYGAAKLEAPTREVFAASPITAALAAGIAAGVWYLRDNPKEHQKLFGRTLAEAEIVAGMHRACAVCDGKAPPVPPVSKATDAATRDATDAAGSGAVASFLIACTSRCWNMYQGGNHWAGWTAFLSFFRHVAKLDIDYTKFDCFEKLAHFGPRFVHKRFWIISARPDFIRIDPENRPHCENGPYCRWPDGRELFYWHGTQVPKEWILAPKTIDARLALTWENVEQRRCLAEIIGWKRVIEQLKPKTINTDKDPQIGTLLEVDLPGSGRERFIQVRCGTGRYFVLPVPPEMTSAAQANAWTYGLDTADIRKLELRT